MRRLFFWAIIPAIAVFIIFLQFSPKTIPEVEVKAPVSLAIHTETPSTDIKFIDGDCNSYSGSLRESDIERLSYMCTKVIIRLNGDTDADKGHLSIAEEAAICAKNGIHFYYFNIEGHVEDYAQSIAGMMVDGGVHVHCRNGAHRAPAMAAYYLRSIDVPKDLVVRMVGWTKLAANPGGYSKYTSIALK